MKQEDIKEVDTYIGFYASGERLQFIRGTCQDRPFCWPGLRDTNILVGDNNTGKTTLLRTVHRILQEHGVPVVYTPDYLQLHDYDRPSGNARWDQLLAPAKSIGQKPFVYIIDNAELYLDLHRQSTLIDAIRGNTPKVQLILSTTSPGVFSNGWQNRIYFIDSLFSEDQWRDYCKFATRM